MRIKDNNLRIELLRELHFGDGLNDSEVKQLNSLQKQFHLSVDKELSATLNVQMFNSVRELRASGESKLILAVSEATKAASQAQAKELIEKMAGFAEVSSKPLTKQEAQAQSRTYIKLFSASVAPVALLPGSTFYISAAQVVLVDQIAKCYSVEDYDKLALSSTLVAATVGRYASEVLSFVPGLGWLIKGSIAAGLTWSIGETISAFFYNCSPLPESAAEESENQ